jgi:hypothetical protein
VRGVEQARPAPTILGNDLKRKLSH